MKFKKNKRYIGIVYNKSTAHVSIREAKESGIKEVFTRHGRPYAVCDADVWVELPDNPIDAQRKWFETVGDMPFTETNRVIWARPNDDVSIVFAAGGNLITRP